MYSESAGSSCFVCAWGIRAGQLADLPERVAGLPASPPMRKRFPLSCTTPTPRWAKSFEAARWHGSENADSQGLALERQGGLEGMAQMPSIAVPGARVRRRLASARKAGRLPAYRLGKRSRPRTNPARPWPAAPPCAIGTAARAWARPMARSRGLRLSRPTWRI